MIFERHANLKYKYGNRQMCIRDRKEENISKRQAVAELIVEKANSFVIGNMGEKFRYLIPFVAAPVSYTHLTRVLL